MFSIVFKAFRNNFLFLLLFSIVLEGISLFDFSGSTGTNLFISAILAFYFHRIILLDLKLGVAQAFASRGESDAGAISWAFMWRFACLLGVGALVNVAIAIGLLIFVEGFLWGSENEILVFPMVALALTAPVFLLMLAFVGTVLPAAALKDDMSFGMALRRGRKTFWRTFGRLLLGNFVIGTVIVGGIIAVAGQWPLLFDDVNNPVLTFCIGTLASQIGLIPPLFTATALCMAFRAGNELIALEDQTR